MSFAWLILILALFVSSFGFVWCFTIFIALFTFLFGFYSLLYIKRGDVDKFYRQCTGNPLTTDNVSDGGLTEIVRTIISPKKFQKTDSRVTGSELIDSSLQEILHYIIRDYVHPWYNLISSDDEFSQNAVRRTAQTLAINISNRVKDVDWIPYLTTRLVDDAATHLRLYKQARAKMKNDDKAKTPKNSPRKEQYKPSPRKSHKRNKSETDVVRYFGNKVPERRNVPDHDKCSKVDEKMTKTTMEDHFFDLECQMENNTICRDAVSTNNCDEKEFLSEVVELLLYILLPDEDFTCKSLRYILREVFANCVLLPVFSLLSDPDYINQAFIWLCLRENSLPSEIFLTTLRLTDNCDELKCTKEIVLKEIEVLRSRDSGGESDLAVKQQLSSLYYVIKLIDNRLSKADNFEHSDLLTPNDVLPLESAKRIDLPLDFILKNNVALSYFIDYVSSQKLQPYLFFYLNIEAWKSSVEHQLTTLTNKTKIFNDPSAYENIRSTALNVYEQYLKDNSELKVDIDQSLIHKLFFKIKNPSEMPSDLWFDDIRAEIIHKLEVLDEFLPAFKRSNAYIKLLQDLDLIQQSAVEEDAISVNSLDSLEDLKMMERRDENLKAINNFAYLSVDVCEKNIKHVRSLSDVTDLHTESLDEPVNNGTRTTTTNNTMERNGNVNNNNSKPNVKSIPVIVKKEDLKSGEFTISVRFIETGIVCDKGKTFGIYAIQVLRQYDSGFLEQWHIYRRYSDFYDFHSRIKDKYPDLSKIAFPAKKTFHNMERSVLELRMRMLGSYMQELCQSNTIQTHYGLRDLLMNFLEQGDYDRATSGGPISNTIDTIVNPLKSGMKTIKNMPEQFISTVDEVVEGLNKVFHSKSVRTQEASKVGASIDIESDDNIPLRIMLLLMDEVFDLKSRNQWLRRRIVTLLRQIVRTMFGDIVNRRILDYVSVITSPKNVAHYLHIFKHSFWPNGIKAEQRPVRDESTKYRTRIAAKVALLSCLSDELKHIIGSETTRKGLLTVFDMFQRPILNRRLVYVLLEGVLANLFPEKNMVEIFQKLHSKSKRYQDKCKLSTLINR